MRGFCPWHISRIQKSAAGMPVAAVVHERFRPVNDVSGRTRRSWTGFAERAVNWSGRTADLVGSVHSSIALPRGNSSRCHLSLLENQKIQGAGRMHDNWFPGYGVVECQDPYEALRSFDWLYPDKDAHRYANTMHVHRGRSYGELLKIHCTPEELPSAYVSN
jgi:hypothetical protein